MVEDFPKVEVANTYLKKGENFFSQNNLDHLWNMLKYSFQNNKFPLLVTEIRQSFSNPDPKDIYIKILNELKRDPELSNLKQIILERVPKEIITDNHNSIDSKYMEKDRTFVTGVLNHILSLTSINPAIIPYLIYIFPENNSKNKNKVDKKGNINQVDVLAYAQYHEDLNKSIKEQ